MATFGEPAKDPMEAVEEVFLQERSALQSTRGMPYSLIYFHV
jgi:hypothetical protein